MATVTLSSALRRFCISTENLTGTGRTILELIQDSTQNHPELRQKLLKSETEIHPQILVYLDSRIIQKPREQVPVDENAVVNLLLIVGGG